MSQPYVGEIRVFAGNFAPSGWMFCEGQLLAIAQNDVLFQLIGTTYGGDGQSTFALPDLRGRRARHQGQGVGLSNTFIGESSGVEAVTLGVSQMPSHNHVARASGGVGHISEPAGAAPAANRDYPAFDAAPGTPFSNASITPSGGSQPHSNVPPFLCVSFIISLFGIFPSPN